jgi:hypothetical protein
MVRFQRQLADEKNKSTNLTAQLASSKPAMEAKDKALGLTELKNQIQQAVKDAEALARQAARAREEMASLEKDVTLVETKLLKLREREGKLWLIPDKSSTTKEPILVTVSKSGAKLERFEHAGQARELAMANAMTGFESYLNGLKPSDQYVVFLIKPSGIELFNQLVAIARTKNFDVGYDALEEDREIFFTTPPPLDEEPYQSQSASSNTNGMPAGSTAGPGGKPNAKPAAAATAARMNGLPPSSTAGPAGVSNTIPAEAGAADTNVNGMPTNSTVDQAGKINGHPTATNVTNTTTKPTARPGTSPVEKPKKKSWWQRFLEFIGLA